MQKHIALFAMFVMGASTSVKAVEKSATATALDNFLHSFDQSFQDYKLIRKQNILEKFLEFALRSSIAPEDIHKEEHVKNLTNKLGTNSRVFEANPKLLQYFLNELQNLDFKQIINRMISDNRWAVIPKPVVYRLAKEIIPLALSKGKKDEGTYFYEQIIKSAPEEEMRHCEFEEDKQKYKPEEEMKKLENKYPESFKKCKILNVQLIGSLLHPPAQLNNLFTQDDMDCAFWLVCLRFVPESPYDFLDQFLRLFSSKTIKPSIEIVKKAFKDRDFIWSLEGLRVGSNNQVQKAKIQKAELTLKFLDFFIRCQSTTEEQKNLQYNLRKNPEKLKDELEKLKKYELEKFKGELKNLRNNVGEYPKLGTALHQMRIDDRDRKLLEGDDPWIKRIVLNTVNIESGCIGEMVQRLAKNPVFKLKDGRELPLKSIVGVLIPYCDRMAYRMNDMPENVILKIKIFRLFSSNKINSRLEDVKQTLIGLIKPRLINPLVQHADVKLDVKLDCIRFSHDLEMIEYKWSDIPKAEGLEITDLIEKGRSEEIEKRKIDTKKQQTEEDLKEGSMNQSLSTQNQTTDSVNQSLSTLDESLSEPASKQSNSLESLNESQNK